MGYALYDSTRKDDTRFSWRLLVLLVILANIPDADFLPGLLVGNANQWHHHYFSHSLGAAIIVGLFTTYFYTRGTDRKFAPYFGLFFGAYFSHLVLDYFTADTSEPLGLPIFWPLTTQYFYSPKTIFMAVHKIGASEQFFQSLFVLHNVWVLLWEAVVFVPILSIIKIAKVMRAKRTTQRAERIAQSGANPAGLLRQKAPRSDN
jgi:inner membrane protein